MEHGRADLDSLDGEMGCEGLGGGRLHSSHNHCGGRNGERFGWGREGRVRLEDSTMRHRRSSSMGGLMGGIGGLNLGRGGIGGGGGLLGGIGGLGGGMGDFGGGRRRGPLDGPGNRGLPFLGRGLDEVFMEIGRAHV